MLNMEPNFLRIYLTNPYDFIFKILFRKSLFFWYMKILLRSSWFWDIKILSSNFNLDMLIGFFMLIKKECMECEKR